ncbi:MAG: hypothetical protein BWY76_02929 [bacterium ADurb.Bin429]|nr:MAG: hypothetical protein BWY76_02929 [bacterium ADurb.Bin429]
MVAATASLGHFSTPRSNSSSDQTLPAPGVCASRMGVVLLASARPVTEAEGMRSS